MVLKTTINLQHGPTQSTLHTSHCASIQKTRQLMRGLSVVVYIENRTEYSKYTHTVVYGWNVRGL